MEPYVFKTITFQ